MTQALGSHPAVPGVQASALTPWVWAVHWKCGCPPRPAELRSFFSFSFLLLRVFFSFIFFSFFFFLWDLAAKLCVFLICSRKPQEYLVRQSNALLLSWKIPVGWGRGTRPSPKPYLFLSSDEVRFPKHECWVWWCLLNVELKGWCNFKRYAKKGRSVLKEMTVGNV